MSYIDLINNFWQTRRTKKMTSNEADLYFYLLHECNLRGWENPFACPNVLVCATIGCTEKSLIEVRNRLKSKGFIDFEAGKRNEKPPVYTILYCKKVSKTVSKTVSKMVSKTVSKTVSKEGNNIIDKTKIEEEENVKEKTTRFSFHPPTLSEIQDYCRERNNSVDPERFYNFYQSKGWMVGKNKMKDWKAAVRTWERSENKPNRNAYGTHKQGTTKEQRDEEFARHIAEKLGTGHNR